MTQPAPSDRVAAESRRRPGSTNTPNIVFQKVRIRFCKEGHLRFIGHHDLMRCWERLVRRTGLKVRFSQGFHPLPRISFPLPLRLGVLGLDEVVEIEFCETLPIETIEQRLKNAAALFSLKINRVDEIPAKSKARVTAVEYDCPVPEERWPLADRQADQLQRLDSIIIERHKPGKAVKRVDIRPNLEAVRLVEGRLWFRLRVNETTVRDEEFLQATGLSIPQGGDVVRRVRVDIADETNEDD